MCLGCFLASAPTLTDAFLGVGYLTLLYWVLVIRFYSEKALRQLLNTGLVYTLRARPRRTGLARVASRNGIIGIGQVRLIGIIDLSRPEALRPYLAYSGFSSIGEWVSEFRRLNGNTDKAFLYEVRLVREK